MEKNYLYTLAFLKRKDEILMLNRQKAPWFGVWNGVGGKREKDETPLQCILREVFEETGIALTPDRVKFKGTLSWNDQFVAASSGLYLFFAALDDDFVYPAPRKTPEGILDWKKVEWIMHPRNLGVAYNIPRFLPALVGDPLAYHYHCVFEGDRLVRTDVAPLDRD